MRRIDICFAFVCIGLCTLIADLRNDQWAMPSWWLPHDHRQLGGEYDNIARSLRAGQGFSNPFGVDSGATGWMPPVLPAILALLYWLADDDRHAVIGIVLTLKPIVLFTSAWILFRESSRLGVPNMAAFVLPVALTYNFYEFFQVTNDEWWLLLLVNIIWIGATGIGRERLSSGFASGKSVSLAYLIGWGLLGGITALSSPVLGAVWAGTTFISGWHASNWGRFPFRVCWIAGLTSILVIAPWTIRNRVVLSAWFPIKSNAGYELWQSQCLDNDGLLSNQTFDEHPFTYSGPEREQYLAKGELNYVLHKGNEAKNSIVSNPSEYFRRVLNRTTAAFIWYHPYSKSYDRLLWPMRFQKAAHPLPFLSMILLLFARRRSGYSPQLVSTVAIYMLALLPYALISYYDRYAAPLLTIKWLLLLYALAEIKFSWLAESGQKPAKS